MSDREFILQRIQVYAGRPVDPDSDFQVSELLRDKFNIQLPQRSSFVGSLKAASKTHEIMDLIIEYRSTKESG